jgi:hypothetical protein
MDVQKTMEFIVEQQAQTVAVQARHEADIARVDLRLRRAIRLAIQEALNERKRRRELDEKMGQFALAQSRNEDMIDRLGTKIDKLSDKIDRLVDAGLHGGNGHQQ